jgi:hypothetical protein
MTCPNPDYYPEQEAREDAAALGVEWGDYVRYRDAVRRWYAEQDNGHYAMGWIPSRLRKRTT